MNRAKNIILRPFRGLHDMLSMASVQEHYIQMAEARDREMSAILKLPSPAPVQEKIDSGEYESVLEEWTDEGWRTIVAWRRTPEGGLVEELIPGK